MEIDALQRHNEYFKLLFTNWMCRLNAFMQLLYIGDWTCHQYHIFSIEHPEALQSQVQNVIFDTKLLQFIANFGNLKRTGEWPTPWTQSLIINITLPKKGNLQLCQKYRTASLISHSSKVMLKVILNRLKPQAEEIIAEEQAGFRAGRSTTEQIFDLRILCEKYLQHQQNLYHVFIDSKKPLTEYGTQPYGPPCGSTISVQI